MTPVCPKLRLAGHSLDGGALPDGAQKGKRTLRGRRRRRVLLLRFSRVSKRERARHRMPVLSSRSITLSMRKGHSSGLTASSSCYSLHRYNTTATTEATDFSSCPDQKASSTTGLGPNSGPTAERSKARSEEYSPPSIYEAGKWSNYESTVHVHTVSWGSLHLYYGRRSALSDFRSTHIRLPPRPAKASVDTVVITRTMISDH